MRVGVGGQTMRGPARVNDAQRTGHGFGVDGFGERLDAADTFAQMQAVAVQRADARGVITAIFEPPEAVEQQWAGGFFPDVTDDSTHNFRKLCWEARPFAIPYRAGKG